MGDPITAEDVLPLIAKLSPEERVRLFRLAKTAATDADIYRAAPTRNGEFDSDNDLLSWDAQGWDSFE